MSELYKKSGVNLEAGYEGVRRIKNLVKDTKILGSISQIGAFSGCFDLSKYNLKNPMLLFSCDGVGTKIFYSFLSKKYNSIGIDLVAMCVNDLICQGGIPITFLDYIALENNDPEVVEQIASGICKGCIIAGCELIGGETAEMNKLYKKDEFDVAGFSCGILEKEDLITGLDIKKGDILIGIKSSGLHSNGYSLVRKIIDDNKINVFNNNGFDKPLIEELLTPTRIYVKDILDIKNKVKIKGMSNITGGGFYENIPRMYKDGLGAYIDLSEFNTPKIFTFLEKLGNVDKKQMYNVFNMGIGFVLCVDKKDKDFVLENLADSIEIGYITDTNKVEIKL